MSQHSEDCGAETVLKLAEEGFERFLRAIAGNARKWWSAPWGLVELHGNPDWGITSRLSISRTAPAWGSHACLLGSGTAPRGVPCPSKRGFLLPLL